MDLIASKVVGDSTATLVLYIVLEYCRDLEFCGRIALEVWTHIYAYATFKHKAIDPVL
jgi:hypothetical protein